MKRLFIHFLSCSLVLLACVTLGAQQVPDSHFNAHVSDPAYKKDYPRVLFDEAHYNSHTAAGGYKPFADLIFSDGFQLVVNRKPFARESLKTFKILIVANPLGAEESDDEGAAKPAFTDEEADTVREWVRGGGSLLLIADDAPFGAAAEVLAKRLDVVMSKGLITDAAHADPKWENPAYITYSRENKLLADNAITRGRNDAEQVNRVIVFAGQSVKGPEGSETILKVSPGAVDRGSPATSKEPTERAQGIAFRFGKGRVVVLGDAALLTAQVDGYEKTLIGMNVPGADNRQLALNIMHWLSGLLK